MHNMAMTFSELLHLQKLYLFDFIERFLFIFFLCWISRITQPKILFIHYGTVLPFHRTTVGDLKCVPRRIYPRDF